MPPINLGILAHVDAGKTSLTERLLFEAGVVDHIGSVDDGTTRTDSMDLERRRGITIRAAVTSLQIGDVPVNILDTPGHPDFIAEVERSLHVLDAAVLVLSSVEGVQPQTVILWRALRRMNVPTVLFINKIDRGGADADRVVEQIRRRLSPAALPLSRATGQGRAEARAEALPLDDASLVETVADVDDTVMEAWLEGEEIAPEQIRAAMRRAVPAGTLFPVLCGSAFTGAGIEDLQDAITSLLKPSEEHVSGFAEGAVAGTAEGAEEDPEEGYADESTGRPGTARSATVFSVDHDARGRRVWMRLWGGELAIRDTIPVSATKAERVTELCIPGPGGLAVARRAFSGDIVAVRGLSTARIGHVIGTPPPRLPPKFPPATMVAALEPVDPTQRGALFTALSVLGDEDPLIEPRLDELDGSARIRIHGEVQKEVVVTVLEERFGVRTVFRDTSVICIERVLGSATAVEEMDKDGNPYLATLGLRLEAGETGSGITFHPGIERGNLPAAFISACEEGVRWALEQGLHGWPVTDCKVTMTASGYCPRQSHAHQSFNKAMSTVGADFRNLAPVVVMACLEKARTQVCQPIERFELETPEPTLRMLMKTLGRLGATTESVTDSLGYTRLVGFIPSARISELAATLPNITGGEGVLTNRPDHYSAFQGDEVPTRQRAGTDPRERALWFQAMPR
ncbi:MULTISPECIES: translation factor GTPase family protein [unclassified Streptomyces]|uniref:elongation factor G n=1 Tax=unclassified Streptomyces TaxID=2593676 RepID=UPI001BE5972A|nr:MULTISPECIES: TetM/TetW/TetO/TetS family tetracycline resistance ribosomal protection protein [unclassified Streptomyces]MBT2408158.1 TetM/TetW/TetO/TetS family tetracycline resistance ribosomal protection protein [Streptomyces sp. ISL-21]MBT2609284.1 TetM/TetW/TetO/TetS family tetracycline resistance ribosomal protection protein [Streptomyces sp. ISL-87]